MPAPASRYPLFAATDKVTLITGAGIESPGLPSAGNASQAKCVNPAVRFRLQPVLRPQQQNGFSTLPRRWVVERAFAWLGLNRRLAKDYERLPATSVAFIHSAMIRLMIRRLAHN